MSVRDECERLNEQWPAFAGAFREIHHFILKAMDGNAAAANALFQKYLDGELSDELLRISRRWVQEEQPGVPSSSEGDSIGVAGPREDLAPVRPVARRRSQRAGTSRDYRPHVQGGNHVSPEVVLGERKQTA